MMQCPRQNALLHRYDATHTEAQVTAGWLKLAARYQAAPNIIGADLKNEPFQGTWAEGKPATGAKPGRGLNHEFQCFDSTEMIA